MSTRVHGHRLAITGMMLAAGAAVGRPPPGGGPTPPPDPAIAFRSGSHIYVMNADGTNLKLVLPYASDSALLEPAWSPDASEVVFGGNPGGVRGIWAVRPDGTGVRLIAPTTDSAPQCAWSPVPAPDGQHKIAWTDEAVGDPTNQEIFVVNADGSGVAQLTATAGLHEAWLSWSPDSTRLAVTTFAVASGSVRYDCYVYTLGVDAGGELIPVSAQNLTGVAGSPLNGANIAFCDWARTQDRIALSALGAAGGGSYDTWIVNPANPGSPSRVPVGGSNVSERQPTWSPDDSTIAFWYSSGSKSGVYAVRPDGTGLKELRKGGTAPDWKRAP